VEAEPAPKTHRGPALNEEIEALDHGRSNLREGNAAAALASADAYLGHFPQGSFRLEASLLRVDALLALGQSEAALNEARRHLAAYPTTPAAFRLRRLLKNEPTGTKL
jgi:hypothetical protein